jgi:hypothetical protein
MLPSRIFKLISYLAIVTLLSTDSLHTHFVLSYGDINIYGFIIHNNVDIVSDMNMFHVGGIKSRVILLLLTRDYDMYFYFVWLFSHCCFRNGEAGNHDLGL